MLKSGRISGFVNKYKPRKPAIKIKPKPVKLSNNQKQKKMKLIMKQWELGRD